VPNIISRLKAQAPGALFGRNSLRNRPNLCQLAENPSALPRLVQESPVAMRYLDLLGSLDWSRFPERNLETDWGKLAVPYAAFAAVCLIKLDQRLVYISHLRNYLVEHPVYLSVSSSPPSYRPHRSQPLCRIRTRTENARGQRKEWRNNGLLTGRNYADH
jgi:hypothetical protein